MASPDESSPCADMAGPNPAVSRPSVTITYCTQCNWLLRAAWMAQELLAAFPQDLGAVSLEPATGGAFRIRFGEELIWERTRDGGFPDIRVLKQMVRDRAAPDRRLGHTDQVILPRRPDQPQS